MIFRGVFDRAILTSKTGTLKLKSAWQHHRDVFRQIRLSLELILDLRSLLRLIFELFSAQATVYLAISSVQSEKGCVSRFVENRFRRDVSCEIFVLLYKMQTRKDALIKCNLRSVIALGYSKELSIFLGRDGSLTDLILKREFKMRQAVMELWRRIKITCTYDVLCYSQEQEPLFRWKRNNSTNWRLVRIDFTATIYRVLLVDIVLCIFLRFQLFVRNK